MHAIFLLYLPDDILAQLHWRAFNEFDAWVLKMIVSLSPGLRKGDRIGIPIKAGTRTKAEIETTAFLLDNQGFSATPCYNRSTKLDLDSKAYPYMLAIEIKPVLIKKYELLQVKGTSSSLFLPSTVYYSGPLPVPSPSPAPAPAGQLEENGSLPKKNNDPLYVTLHAPTYATVASRASPRTVVL